MRIIGIDPGMAIVGYAVIELADNNSGEYTLITSGSIQTDKKSDNASRLVEIHKDLIELINSYKPDIAAIEKLFFFKNAKTIMPVAEARGVLVMTLKMHNIPVYEYTPLVVKQAITGYGRSTKDEIKQMITLLLNDDIPKLDDATDAIAIALCHINNFCCNP